MLPRGGGNGPSIRPRENNRELDEAHVSEFVKVAGTDLRGLWTTDPAHSLIIALPRGSYDPASLQKDASDAVPIIWLDAAHGSVGFVLAGNHRMKALQKCNASRLDVLNDFKRQIVASREKGDEQTAQELREKRDDFIKQSEIFFQWMVRVYDLGTLRNRLST